MGLPQLHSVADVAAALGETERFVAEKARLREWPHRRGARGRVGFTDDDFQAVLELIAQPASQTPAPTRRGLSLAPRSARRRLGAT
jgi:hypothetical protein